MTVIEGCRASLVGILLLAGSAQAREPVATTAITRSVEEKALPALRVVDAFSQAMQAGDLKQAASHLAVDVVILESGSVEKSRAEYLEHHAPADAVFLKDAHIQPLARYAKAVGDIAWVASESEIHVNKESKAAVLLSTETMVLKRESGTWHIAHIHWSSRTKKQ